MAFKKKTTTKKRTFSSKERGSGKSGGTFKGRRGKQKSEFSNSRVTGLWETRKEGLAVGSPRQEEVLEMMKDVITTCETEGKMPVFFLYLNDRKSKDTDPDFSLYMRVGEDQGKEIEEDDDDEDEADFI